MANTRFILNETSYFGFGAREVLLDELKDREYNEYKYRKQKYLLELDNESVKNTAKEKVIEKYNRFYVSKQDSLYKGILKNYSIKLEDSTNI